MNPTQEFECLQDFLQRKDLLKCPIEQSQTFGSKKHLILKNPKILDVTAIKMVKPMVWEQVSWPKGVSALDPDRLKAMADSPLENLLRKIVKQIRQTLDPIKIKKEVPSPKPPIPSKPSTSKKKSRGFKKAALFGASAFLRRISVDKWFIDNTEDKDGVTLPKLSRENNPKCKKTEMVKNHPRLGGNWAMTD